MILSSTAHRPALIIQNVIYTFAELQELVDRKSEQIKKQGIKTLVLTADKNIEFITQFLSGLKSGIPIVLFSSDHSLDLRSKYEAMIVEPVFHPETALILFTSGSSGKPKAVQLSLSNIKSNTNAVIETLDFKTAAEQFLFLPLSYSFGILGQLLPALATGVSTHIANSLIDLKTVFDERSATGMLSGVPSHWEAILRLTDSNPSCGQNITHIVSAGAFFSSDLRGRLRRRFPKAKLFNNYGQTEASPRLISMSSDNAHFFSDSTGYPVTGIEARLANDQELLVKGPQIMLGYVGDASGTNEKIKNGWLHTGDIAHMEPDGLTTILGRKDDLIKIGGERISINEIESVLRGFENCDDAAVYIAEDPVYEKKISALLVFTKTPPTRKNLQNYVRLYLNAPRMPKEFYSIDKIPRSSNGKVIQEQIKSCLELAKVDPKKKIV
ncbi:MAG: acyl--CoA ligase [Bdellovibrionales bacterium]|nr:acyl--CoA ligase [Bdellovibrionales bacterium]